MELFDSSLPEPKDREFISILNDPKYIILQRKLETMWREYEPYADPHFLIEIRNSLHSRYWEMYLGYTLLKLKFKLKPKTSNNYT